MNLEERRFSLGKAQKIEVKRFQQLDTLRFIFAAYVVIGHTVGWVGIARNAGLAVDFFFILSGFVLSHLLLAKETSWKNFFLLRIARLWPLHFVTMIAAFMLIPQQQTFKIFFANLFLLQNSGIISGNTLNWPAWSISAEFLVGNLILYPLVRYRLHLIAVAIIILGILVMLKFGGIPHETGQRFGWMTIGLVRCSVGTALGFMTYEAFRRYQSVIVGAPAIGLLQGCLIALLGVMFYVEIGDEICVLCIFISSGLIFLLAASDTGVTRFLSLTQFKWLGSVSFGIYMLHAPFLLAAWNCGLLPHHRILTKVYNAGDLYKYIPSLALFAAIIVISAVLVYRFFEVPTKRVLLRVFGLSETQ